jgi:tRNA 2-thiocytidine biosynthesis protein TtcA
VSQDLIQIRDHVGGGFRYRDLLEKRIVTRAGRCVGDWDLLVEGDRVMVCCSGGKDSYALLDVLILLRRRAPIRFDLIAVNVDQGYDGYEQEVVEAHLRTREVHGVEVRMVSADFKSVLEAKLAPEATPCSLCSRLRRGLLYSLASEIGATKIALGHHADDLIQTLLLNLFFSGKLAAMPPRLASDDGRHVVIRPLAYNWEEDLSQYAQACEYPVVGCACPSCGLPDQKRQVIKRMLNDLERESPGLKQQMLAAIGNIRTAHLLDRELLERLQGRMLQGRIRNGRVDAGPHPSRTG